MRTMLMLVIALLSISMASAAPLTKEEARDAANRFLLEEQANPHQIVSKVGGNRLVTNQALELALGQTRSLLDDSAHVIAYIQELEPQGFIVISSDDALGSVLGFSFTEHFPYTPEGNPLLDLVRVDNRERKTAVRSLSSEGVLPKIGSLSAQWGPYIQTTWSQGGIYRDRCPYKDPSSPGVRRPTGCTAIAMAQIMYMHQFPPRFSFSFDNDHYVSRAVVRDANGQVTSYDLIDIDGSAASYGFPTFDQLNNTLEVIDYDGATEEISDFCFGTGIKLHMTYGRGGSGAWRPLAYLDEFGYGSAVPSRDWNSVRNDVIENMKDGLPVQIAIYNSDPSKTGGHSVIVDGYRDDNFFHLNYGWGANSPESINDTWYNIPAMHGYDVVAMIIYDISVYQGWNQIGADPANSYHARYPVPIDLPFRKWSVSTPSGPSIGYSYNHLVVGTGGKICASLGPSIMGDVYHPFIHIFDKFGTRRKTIEVTHSNLEIPYLCQNSRGEIFFSSGTGGPSTSDSKIYRLNPQTETITAIFTHFNPDAGIAERPIKIDRDNNLFFVIQPRSSVNYSKFYSVERTGTINWWYSFEPTAKFYASTPAIDEAKNQVCLNYYNSATQKSHLIAFNRSSGGVIFDTELPTSTHFASKMAAAPAIGVDGRIYLDANNVLFAISPDDGSVEWQKDFSARGDKPTPAIGNDRTIYVNYDGKLIALDGINGSTKWEKTFELGEDELLSEIYSASNGMVLISYQKDGNTRLGAVKDNGTSYEDRWDMVGGGTLAFGPGRTIYSITPGLQNTILALTDVGYYKDGDPEAGGMDYTNNNPPETPSNPIPADGYFEHTTDSVILQWDCSDLDGHSLKFDVYVCALVEGQEAAFVPLATQLTASACTLTGLSVGTQYLWKVVATDGQAATEGPTWSFARLCPSLTGPDPTTLSPTNGSFGSLDVRFVWGSVSGTSSYALRIDTLGSDENFYKWKLDTISDTTANFTLSNSIISWQVKALGAFPCGDGEWTSPARYTDVDDSRSVPLPDVYSLAQNFPNPFNPVTQISFSLPQGGSVKLEILNALGQKVETLIDGMLNAGEHTATWDASDMASGVYLYRLQAGDFVETKKMMLIK